MTRYAILSDIHGNLPALEAVLEDMTRRNIDRVLNLGDHASGPLWPRETVAFVMQQPWVHLSGNCDRSVVEHDPGASHRYAYDRITAVELEWLASLPKSLQVSEELLIFHGIPDDDDTYLLETVAHGEARLAHPSEISERLGGVTAPVMLCGHSHIPRAVRLGSALIINPGSVGLQAYDLGRPELHVMEVGSPDARYAVLERRERGWQTELITVPYDHEAAAEQAKRSARPDWERALRSGFMRD